MDDVLYPGRLCYPMAPDEGIFIPFKPLPRDSPLFTTDIPLSFIPPYLRDAVFKTFYRGYDATFLAVSFVLKSPPPKSGWSPSCIPSIRAVQTMTLDLHYHLVGALNTFLGKGGHVAFTVDCVTRQAVNTALAPFGDGSFDAKYGASPSNLKPQDASGEDGSTQRQNDWRVEILEGHRAAWNELPVCNNDVKFELLREKVGLDPNTIWGPYSNNL